uniref:Uncharacterized protein n=1 Tax=Psilocybe cubensis TaxID=181762 RepID=A0A8H7XTX2_PSICU
MPPFIHQMAWNQLAAELWTMIADECDEDGVRALCSPEMPPHIRDSARPVQFRNLNFAAYNVLDKLDFNIDRYQFARSLAITQILSNRRFTELPKSPLVRHVRSWRYTGYLVHSPHPGISKREKLIDLTMQFHVDKVWPLFLANLHLYVGLTRLALQNVVIDDVAVTSFNALDNLQSLEITHSIISCTTILRPFDRLTHYTQQEARGTFHVEFMMPVCSTLTYLNVVIGTGDYRKLYSALEQCHVLDALSIYLIKEQGKAFECPPPGVDLSITACPNLSEYIGPAYYYAADIIPGRPLHTIKLNRLPCNAELVHPGCVEWIKVLFTSGTVPVEHFDVAQWPASALCAEETFPTLFHKFPHLISLRIVIEPFEGTGNIDFGDQLEAERWNTYNYLNILHTLSGPLPYKIPPTLRTLELVTEDEYERHPTHTFDKVVAALRHSANFTNLRTLIVGTLYCFQRWTRLESGIWDVIHEGECFNLDGAEREHYSEFDDSSDNHGNVTEEEDT